MYWPGFIFAMLLFGLAFVALILTAYYDWQAGAPQTYVRDDGTIHEWDRFGNQTFVRPGGKVEKVRPEPNKGIGPTLMGMNVSAHLYCGVVIEGECPWKWLEDNLDFGIFSYTSCGHPDASERYVIYFNDPQYGVEWDETLSIRPQQLEVNKPFGLLMKICKELDVPFDLGWHLVAYYG